VADVAKTTSPVELSVDQSAEALWSGTPLPVGSSIQLSDAVRRSIEGAMGSALTIADRNDPLLNRLATGHVRDDEATITATWAQLNEGSHSATALSGDDRRAENDMVKVSANRAVHGVSLAGGSALRMRTFALGTMHVQLHETYRAGMGETPLDVEIVAAQTRQQPSKVHAGMIDRLHVVGQLVNQYNELPTASAASLDFGTAMAEIVFGSTRSKRADGPVRRVWSASSLPGDASAFGQSFGATSRIAGNVGGRGHAARYEPARIETTITVGPDGVAPTAVVELDPNGRHQWGIASIRYVFAIQNGRAVVTESGRFGTPMFR